jgi:hypothetical protein
MAEFLVARIELISEVPSNLAEYFVIDKCGVDRECRFGIHCALHE